MTTPEQWCERFRSAKTRDAASLVYADALIEHGAEMPGPWVQLNGAILMRWSSNALRYIKERAWKEAARRSAPQDPKEKDDT